MNAFAFKVIDAINRDGMDNGNWGLVKDVDNTVAYFGTREEIELKGQWAYIYAEKDDTLSLQLEKSNLREFCTLKIVNCCSTTSTNKAVRAAINRPQARSVAAPAAGGKNERYERHKNWRPGEIRTQYW